MFTIKNQDEKTKARTGTLATAHGKVKTPFLMPVATKGSVKFVLPEQLEECQANAIISNGMILSLRPGADFIQEKGGIHKFINYKHTIFTDSGGFQMQSKGLFQSISDKGVYFKNPFNNQKTFFSPEHMITNMFKLNSDVAMCLDQMPHTSQSKDEWIEATRRTHLWAERCKKHHELLKKEHGDSQMSRQLLFGIAQGGLDAELRKKSAEFINKLDFDGVAMGGLCLGESREAMFKAVEYQVPVFEKDKIRYLMGVGSPLDLIEAVSHGADCFDSIFPTQNARHGHLFTSKGMIKLDRGIFKDDDGPIDEDCDCFICRNYSRAFLRHLFTDGEYTAYIHLSYHNVYFLQRLMRDMQKAIDTGEFEGFKKEFIKNFS